jgi:uncharacterized PurR-regulated membrane protein YhhQ (DUF165 family)
LRYAFLYICNIVLVNWLFVQVPVFTLPGGAAWSPVALLVGFSFIIRDYAQRAIGHLVLPAMLLGGLLSWGMATPAVAAASVAGFMVGEMADWAVYSFTGRPFSQRILLSSLAGAPLDSLVFLSLIGLLSLPTLLGMTLSKLLGALVVFWAVRRREAVPAR